MAIAQGSQSEILLYDEDDYSVTPAYPDATKIYVLDSDLRQSQGLLDDPTLNNSRERGRPQRGNIDVSGNLRCLLTPELLPLLRHALGKITTTGAAAPYTHEVKLGPLPTSFLIEKDFGRNIAGTGRWERMLGNRIASVEFNFPNEGYPEAVFGLVGAKSALASTQLDWTPTDYGYTPFPSYKAIISEDGVPIGNVTDASIRIDNDLDTGVYTLDGSAGRYSLPEGIVKISGKITVLFEDASLLKKAINDTASSLTIEFMLGNGTGTPGNEYMALKVHNLVYGRTSPTISGPKGIRVEMPFTAYKEGTQSAFSILIRNSMPMLTPSLNLVAYPGRNPAGVEFSRDSMATRVNQNRKIVAVESGVLRHDYDPYTGEYLGWLFEESRTNLLLHSSDYTQAVNSNNCTAVPSGTAPDNTSAYLVTVTDPLDPYLEKLASITPNRKYAFSVFAKKGNDSAIEFRTIFVGGTGSEKVSTYNFDTDTLSPAAGITMRRVLHSDGWVRICCEHADTGSNLNALHRVIPASRGIGKTVLVGCAQLEEGITMSSYIPTGSTPVTRAADVARITPIGWWFNTAAGSLFAEARYEGYPVAGAQNRVPCAISSAGGGSQIVLEWHESGNVGALHVVDNWAFQCGIMTSAIASGDTVKIIAAYKANDFAASQNGGAVLTDTSGSVPSDLTSINIGYDGIGNHLNGHIKRIAYYPRRIANADLQGLTS